MKSFYLNLKILFSLLLLIIVVHGNHAQTITAEDNQSDYFIDVNWSLPITPCLLDGANQYSSITLRLTKDGGEIDFQTIDGQALIDLYAAGNPLEGSYRDFVGPNLSHNYEIMVFHGTLGSLDLDCSFINDNGQTSIVKVPDQFATSIDLLDKIELGWTNRSDLATSYKLYRDTILIETFITDIERDSSLNFVEQFLFNSSTSIKSGEDYNYSIEMISSYVNQTWTYNLGDGNTIPLNLMATDAPTFSEKVAVTWDAVPAGSIDKYQLWRDGNLFAIKSASEVMHEDFAPHYGDSIEYNLRVLKNDTVRASFVDYGSVAANGTISGSVFTTEGSFPVENAIVKITRESTGDTLTTLSNDLGEFSFTDVAYGLLDSFEFNAVLPNHSFTYPIPKVGISSLQPNYENAVILDEFSFTQGSSTNNVNSFTAIPDTNNDLVDLSWDLNTSAASFFIDVLRNGEKIYSSTSAADLVSSYQDTEGTPGEEETTYTIRIYNIQGNTISSAEDQVIVGYPNVSDLGNLAVMPDGNGNISLSWVSAVGQPNNSPNIDSFRVYRNDTLIITLDNLIETHTDVTAPFDMDHEYSVTAIISRNNTTYESVNPQVSDPQIINLGPMPTVDFVSTFINGANTLPQISVNWQVPATLPTNYNYTGFFVYQNDELVYKIPKRTDLSPPHPLGSLVFQGFGLTNIEYKVSVYRDTERGIIESQRIAANLVDFPELIEAPTLLANTGTTDSRLVQLSWDPATGGNNNRIDGYYLIYNDIDTFKLDPFVTEFEHFPDLGETTHNYALHRFVTFNGNDILSNQSSDLQINLAPVSPTPPVYAPTNIVVTRDLPNQAKICWEYLDFIPSTFEVYKVGVASTLIATLPEGARFYYDNNADINSATTYKIRAVQNGLYSDFVGADAKVPQYTLVYGNITEPSSGQGFFNARVHVETNSEISPVTYTDSSGYYQIYVPSNWLSSGGNVYVGARTPNGSEVFPLIPTGEYTSYRVDIIRGKPVPIAKTNQAFVDFATVDFDPYELKGYVNWSCSDGNYDGVDINRGFDFLGTVLKAEGNILVDSTAVPGILYNYVLRAFINTPTGKKYGETKTISSQYPELSPVINLTAFPLVESNRVQLQWSHQYNHADGFRINRNGEFLGDVKKDSLFIFSDTTGTAGQSYTYTLDAYKLVNNQIYFSSEENVTATFPSIAKVTNLVATVPDTTVAGVGIINLNHVLLTWDDYPSASLTGYKIFRDNELITQLDPDSTSYEDFFGIPGANTEYSISVLVEQNGSILESDPQMINTNFPDLSSTTSLTILNRSDLGDQELSWSYFAKGIDGFKIKIGNSHTETILLDSEQDAPGNYSFINRILENNLVAPFVLNAFVIRDGIEYISFPWVLSSQYPSPPPLTSTAASEATFDNAVEVTWTIPSGANFDQFRLVKTAQSDPSVTETIFIDKNQRSYFDLFAEGDLIDTFNYVITSMRTVNGFDYFSNPSSDLGWPGKALNADGAPGQGNEVAIDGNWMVAGDAFNKEINIYKFENNEWVFKQNFTRPADTDFGVSVDISDQLIVASSPGTEKAVVYRLDQGTWFEEAILSDVGLVTFGKSVAIDDEIIVVGGGNGSIAISHLNLFNVYRRNPGQPYSSNATYSQITKNSSTTNVPELDTWAERSFDKVDIDGDDILLGAPSARNSGAGPEFGLVVHCKIVTNEIVPQDVILDLPSISNNLGNGMATPSNDFFPNFSISRRLR